MYTSFSLCQIRKNILHNPITSYVKSKTLFDCGRQNDNIRKKNKSGRKKDYKLLINRHLNKLDFPFFLTTLYINIITYCNNNS